MSIYVGIPNDGAFCYLISVVQQLYFMHDFRKIIMTTDSENEVSQALILNVRKLFTALDNHANEEELDCIPLFEHLYKDLVDGIYTQKDASEFLSDFVRSLGLETQLKGLLTGQLVNTLSTEIDGCGSPRILSKPEKFLFTSITVNCPAGRVNNLQNSLLDFTKSETINYKWVVLPNTNPDTSLTSTPLPAVAVPTEKRTLFRTLPKHLTFHLKRFRFNVSSMKKEKLHHRFEFPDELDMSPYMATDIPSSSANDPVANHAPVASRRYKLSGVVVHKGKSAYWGHYYSFIRERGNAVESSAPEDSAHSDVSSIIDKMNSVDISGTNATTTTGSAPNSVNNNSTAADRWFLFDDFDVMPFDPADVERQCFGGPRGRRRGDSASSESSSESSSASSGSRSTEGDGDGGDDEGGNAESHSVFNERISTHSELNVHSGVDVVSTEHDDTSTHSHHSTSTYSSNSSSSSSTNSNTSSDSSSDSDSSSYYSDSDSDVDPESCQQARGNYKSAFMLFYERIDT